MSILVVRHGSAGNHLAWEGGDADRPLDSRGTAQAASLAEAFADFPVSVVLSSRAVRCQQTVLPLARRTGLEVAPDPVLCEGASLRALRLVETLARGDDQNDVAVLCSHGDVISEMLHNLMLTGVRTHGNRGCAEGSVWELSCRGGVVVEGRYHHPPTA